MQHYPIPLRKREFAVLSALFVRNAPMRFCTAYVPIAVGDWWRAPFGQRNYWIGILHRLKWFLGQWTLLRINFVCVPWATHLLRHEYTKFWS